MAPRNSQATFPQHEVTAPFSFPAEEEKVLEFWKDIDA